MAHEKVKDGQEVTWKLGSFGFREAVRRGDEDAIAALQSLVGKAFNRLNELSGDFEYGDFSLDGDDFEEEQAQVCDAILQKIEDSSTAEAEAIKKQDAAIAEEEREEKARAAAANFDKDIEAAVRISQHPSKK
jgi:hypothetical protein